MPDPYASIAHADETLQARLADVLASSGSMGKDQAEALKSEARRRADAGAFFGHISYVSVIARKPR